VLRTRIKHVRIPNRNEIQRITSIVNSQIGAVLDNAFFSDSMDLFACKGSDCVVF